MDIRQEMTRHFKKVHKRPPRKDLYRVNFRQDFKVNRVRLWSYGQNAPVHPYTYQSRLYRSYDYCIAVIIWYEYRILDKIVQDKKTSSRQKQQSLRPMLQPYF